MPEVLLAVSLVSVGFTALTLAAPRRPAVLCLPMWMAAWVTGELAGFHVAWQLALTAALVVFGALRDTAGWAGLAVLLVSWTGLLVITRRHGTAVAALAAAVGDATSSPPDTRIEEASVARAAVVSRRQLLAPFRMRPAGVTRTADIAYGEGRRHRLDVYRHRDAGDRCPVIVQIHGGAWVVGDKRQQGQPLLYHLAQRGWVGVAPNYRRSPAATFPDHLVDVKRALAWVRQHGAEYGMDPGFVVVTGGSAGGHLAALVALTPNDARYQPGFEDVDTTVAACVPMYGVYDFLDRDAVRGPASRQPFLERVVMKCPPAACPERWEAASPIRLVRADAPPFFVVHGSHDTLVWVEEARSFVEALRAVSRNPVLYAELPDAEHAFDVLYTRRTAYVIDAVARWLDTLRRRSTGPAPAAGRGVVTDRG